jgi:peptidoglycan hydrolase-like protein with peptidoglycan-binding domain
MKRMKRILTLIVAVAILSTAVVIGTTTASASGSGAGLTEWAYRAYNEGWSYVWGGTSVGAVDCSGLIYSYAGGARTTEEMIAASSESGSIDTIPRVHGLGVYQYGHVGVYVGGGMAIDARDENSNVCLDSVSSKSWTQWFKISGVSYPTSGWQSVAGSYYYYEDGQYIVNTSRTIGGVTYTFGSDGASDKTPDDTNSKASSSSSTKKTVKKTAYSIGDSGSAVTKLQKRLKALGFYDDEITGYFGEATEKAYKAFQKAAGVTIDGICGKSDRDILYSSSAPLAVEETTEAEETTDSQEEDTEEETEENDVMSIGDYSDDVYSVQERLIELKYFDDSATGYFGQLTQQAVKDFQDYNEIENTGEVDDETETVLFSDDAIANPEATEEAEEAQEEEDSDTTATTEDVEENQEETVPVPSSSVVLESNKMASDALAGLTSDSDFSSVTENNSDGTGIIKWLIIVIAVMGAVFVVVLVNERKKAKRRSKHAMQRSRKYW